MTYDVFSGTLKPTQSINQLDESLKSIDKLTDISANAVCWNV